MNEDPSSSLAAQRAHDPHQQSTWYQKIRARWRREPESDVAVEDHGKDESLRQENLLVSLRNLQETRISDIAVPTADIVALDVNAPLTDMLNALREHGYSRYPIFEDTIDNPLGLVHIKDVLIATGFEAKVNDFPIRDFVRPMLYAPPSMRLGMLLQKMQSEHVHLALVIDEYGGVDGLLTIEDILEQIVGDITDEHDEAEEALFKEEKPGVFIAQARTHLDEFAEETGVDFQHIVEDEDVDTMGGLVVTLTARVPAKGEVIKLQDGTEFEIVDADPRRVKRIRIRVTDTTKEA